MSEVSGDGLLKGAAPCVKAYIVSRHLEHCLQSENAHGRCVYPSTKSCMHKYMIHVKDISKEVAQKRTSGGSDRAQSCSLLTNYNSKLFQQPS